MQDTMYNSVYDSKILIEGDFNIKNFVASSQGLKTYHKTDVILELAQKLHYIDTDKNNNFNLCGVI